MPTKKTHAELIAEAKRKAEGIIAGQERSIYHFGHIESEGAPSRKHRAPTEGVRELPEEDHLWETSY